MSQTQFDPSQTRPKQPSANSDNSPTDDPMAHLHKMSTTAGVGSGEYVAVNGTAVAALMLGFASALTLLDEVLLVLPIACIVVSFFALRQIARSNGTQTGKGLVIIGLLAAIGFGGFVVARKATEGIRTRADRELLTGILASLGEKIKTEDYAGAYGLFSKRFTDRVNRETFDHQMKWFHNNELYGKLNSISGNGLVDFVSDEATGAQSAVTTMQLALEKAPQPLRETVIFQKVGDQWFIDSFGTLFAPPSKQQQQ